MALEKSKTVSFRIPTNYWTSLLERATERGVSPGDFARQVLLEALLRDSFESVKLELSLIRGLIERMKDNQQMYVLALLTKAGKTTVDEAKDFIRRNLQ